MRATRSPVAIEIGRDPTFRLGGVGASLALHALLLTAILLSPAGRMILPDSERIVSVAMVPPPTLAEPALPESLSAPALDAREPAAAAAGRVRATSMLSAKALADPRSARAREAMRTLAGSERVVQLCNIEAMQQIAEWRRDLDPDRVVAYARQSERFDGKALHADGAAVHIGDEWFDLKFNCELGADRDVVTAFEFELGAAIPAAVREELGLPEGVDDDDG